MTNLVLGFIAAFLLAALPGKAAIGWLRKLGAKQTISTDAPQAHSAKQGTPTMGGLLILFSLTVTTLFYAVTVGGEVGVKRLLPILFMTLGFGGIGFLDDFLSARRGKNLGLRAREKLAAQFIIAIGFAFWLWGTAQPYLTTAITVTPGGATYDFGASYYVLAVLFLVSLSNATNITDGLDGLSSGLTILVSVALGALVSGGALARELGFFPTALAGALAGFLWWNAHPAKVFMGDTASLALGAGLGGVALVAKQEVALIVASLVMWAELFSVIVQVSVFKWRKRTKGLDYAKANRVFRRTPLHHHFEEIGWAETSVVLRFWLVGAICAALAMLWSR